MSFGFSKKKFLPFLFIVSIIVIVIGLILKLQPFDSNDSDNAGFINSDGGQVVSDVKSGNCVVLQEEFCSVGKVFEHPNFPGIIFIGFNLPEGTPIFASRDGVVQHDKSGIFPSANLIQLINPSVDQSVFEIAGDVKAVSSDKFKKGDIIATVQDTGVEVEDEYNLVINFGTHSSGRYITDTLTLGTLFPNVK